MTKFKQMTFSLGIEQGNFAQTNRLIGKSFLMGNKEVIIKNKHAPKKSEKPEYELFKEADPRAMMFASQQALALAWDTDEEDDAWKDL